MYSEFRGYFLNINEGSFEKDGQKVSYFKVTVCDGDGLVDSFSVSEKDRNAVRKQAEEIPLFAPVFLSLFIKGKGQYMKAYAESISERKEE